MLDKFKVKKHLHKYLSGGYKEATYLLINYNNEKLLLTINYNIGYIKVKMGKSVIWI